MPKCGIAIEWAANATTSRYPDAVYRSVISRAYYAVFHAAFDLAQALGLQATRSAGDHYRLRKFFEERGRISAQLSVALRILYSLPRAVVNPVTVTASTSWEGSMFRKAVTVTVRLHLD